MVLNPDFKKYLDTVQEVMEYVECEPVDAAALIEYWSGNPNVVEDVTVVEEKGEQ